MVTCMANKGKIIKNEHKYDWLSFAQNFLFISKISCEKMLEKDCYIIPLFLPTLYNIKHGIEVFIKSAMVLITECELGKEDRKHSAVELFERLKIIINYELIKKVIEDAHKKNPDDNDFKNASKDFLPGLPQRIESLDKLVAKYQNCEIIKDKIGNYFEIDDEDNTAFRYPENNLKIKLNYDMILINIKTNDVVELLDDVKNICNNFNSLGYVLNVYSRAKKYVTK